MTLAVIDPCGVNPCRNGGTCTAVVTEFKCICPLGYKGDRCEGKLSTVNFSSENI